ncbi:hypothetical protein D9C73_006868 [Collichthys lucidus]|uniref:Uncharacterized protein n=1 Tax=Collichthys lucidus TaxID=240159 RepID=A0A4U5UFC5_COLLU|nr:hypothetical protein D9C73_006868 [Collichthys lucidus]
MRSPAPVSAVSACSAAARSFSPLCFTVSGFNSDPAQYPADRAAPEQQALVIKMMLNPGNKSLPRYDVLLTLGTDVMNFKAPEAVFKATGEEKTNVRFSPNRAFTQIISESAEPQDAVTE